MPSENPEIGSATERLFKNTVGRDRGVIEALKQHFGIQGNFGRAFKTGTEAGKSDVIIRFDSGASLNANVKAFSAGFNQLTRTTIRSFCIHFELATLQQTLETGAIRKAGKTGRFIAQEDEKTIIDSIQPLAKRIVHYSLSNLENPELFVLFDRTNKRFHLFDMAQMLDDLDYTVSISPLGTIRIGNYITIQRKGGNGVRFNHISKTSLSHPGNNLQVKMNVKAFLQNTEPIVSYTP